MVSLNPSLEKREAPYAEFIMIQYFDFQQAPRLHQQQTLGAYNLWTTRILACASSNELPPPLFHG
jgi:hypothetical protein